MKNRRKVAERLRKLADSASELAGRLRKGEVRMTDIGKLRTFSGGEPVCVVGVLISNAGLKRLLASQAEQKLSQLSIKDNEEALARLGVPDEMLHLEDGGVTKFGAVLEDVTNINDAESETTRLKEMPTALMDLSKTLRKAADKLLQEADA